VLGQVCGQPRCAGSRRQAAGSRQPAAGSGQQAQTEAHGQGSAALLHCPGLENLPLLLLMQTLPAGNYMSSKEQACMDNCARRFLESTQFVVSQCVGGGWVVGGAWGGAVSCVSLVCE